MTICWVISYKLCSVARERARAHERRKGNNVLATVPDSRPRSRLTVSKALVSVSLTYQVPFRTGSYRLCHLRSPWGVCGSAASTVVR